jgi:enterochelin esterase-like enzyme
MKKIIAFAAAVLALACTLRAQEVKEQDPAAHVARVFPISVEHLYFHSNVLGVDKNFSVMLPKSYTKEPDRRYPVVYMLHGAGENDWEWANIAVPMISEAITMITNDGTAAECIVVFPNANEAGHMGYFNQPDWKYEDYFFQELMPLVDKRYRTIPDKGHRAIGGLSMGGGGSFNYGMRHPELFSSVYAISAAVSPAAFSSAEANPGVLPATMNGGTYTGEQVEAAKSVYFVLDCGDDDFLFDANVATYQQMRKNGMTVQFRCFDGAHASYYWYDALRRALAYMSRHFSTQMP